MAGRAIAYINGGTKKSEITGRAEFFEAVGGTEIKVNIYGLPHKGREYLPFGLSLCEAMSCEQIGGVFPGELGRYSPANFPKLLSTNGDINIRFLSEEISVNDIIGHTIVILDAHDSDKILACGLIREFEEHQSVSKK